MEKEVWRIGVLITGVTVLGTAMVWAQPDHSATGNLPRLAEKPASSEERSTACGTTIIPEFAQRSDEQRPPVDDIIVAEDMRCRQCHGKCSADSLRCRSQCASDSACLVHCEERTRNCESMCKQIFQCQ